MFTSFHVKSKNKFVHDLVKIVYGEASSKHRDQIKNVYKNKRCKILITNIYACQIIMNKS